MNVVELFLKYLPVLMVLTPLVGVMNAVVVYLVDRPSVSRTFLPNLCLTTGLLAVLLFVFEYGPQRSGLFFMESFQFHSQLSLPILGTDRAIASLASFGVDGLSLPLIAMVVIFPLMTFFREGSASCVVLSLCLQTSLLAVVTSLDWRIACGALFTAALLLRLILARTLSVREIRQTSRWSGRTFLGDVMLAGGTLYLFLLASNFLQIRGANHSEVIYQLRDYFTRIEYFQDFDPERVVGLTLKSSPAIGLLLMGVLLRLPIRMSQSNSVRSERVAGMWMWLYGPVVAVSFATRAFQFHPEFAYAFLAPIRTILISLILILGLISSVSSATREGHSQVMKVLLILMVVGLCTPNPASIAGMYLLLGFLPILWTRCSIRPLKKGTGTSGTLVFCAEYRTSLGGSPHFQHSASANKTSNIVPLTVIPVVLGSLLILLGLFQGGGSGDRGLMDLLVTGTGLTLCVLSMSSSKSLRNSLIVELPNPHSDMHEFPSWESDHVVSRKNESDSKPRASWSLMRAVLILCLLIFPQQVWQRIRWDVQRIDFPTTSADSHLTNLQSFSRDSFKNSDPEFMGNRNVSEGNRVTRNLSSPLLTRRVSIGLETASREIQDARDAGEEIR